MTDPSPHPIRFPEQSADLIQHQPVHVALALVTPKGDRPVLAGRSSTTHLKPEGAILQIRPQLQRPWPVRRGDQVTLRMSSSAQQPPLEVSGQISWVRDRAFLPSGLAVSLVGVTFGWDPDEMALEVAAFLA